jgi:hypothetical protein
LKESLAAFPVAFAGTTNAKKTAKMIKTCGTSMLLTED